MRRISLAILMNAGRAMPFARASQHRGTQQQHDSAFAFYFCLVSAAVSSRNFFASAKLEKTAAVSHRRVPR